VGQFVDTVLEYLKDGAHVMGYVIGDEGGDSLRPAARSNDGQRGLARHVTERVRVVQGGQVGKVVGVHVADPQGVQLSQTDVALQFHERPRTGIDPQRGIPTSREVAGTGIARHGERRGRTHHRQGKFHETNCGTEKIALSRGQFGQSRHSHFVDYLWTLARCGDAQFESWGNERIFRGRVHAQKDRQRRVDFGAPIGQSGCESE
jgi:hypothetical protein